MTSASVFTKAWLLNNLYNFNQQQEVNEAEATKCHAFVNAFCVRGNKSCPVPKKLKSFRKKGLKTLQFSFANYTFMAKFVKSLIFTKYCL